MSFGKKVECIKCEKQESLMWHRIEEGVQCNECLEVEQMALKVKKEEEEEKKSLASVEKSKSAAKKNVRSTRSYKTRQNPNALPKQVTPKGKGRRQIFKKNPPIKLTPAPPSMKTVTSVFHKGMFYRVGDVVSLVGAHDGGTYYAQISGLLIDDYCEKSASLTWLIPTRGFDRSRFNPMDYVLGYDDDLPRKLDYMEFVMHSPLEYYRNNYPSQYTPSYLGSTGFIWGRLSHINSSH